MTDQQFYSVLSQAMPDFTPVEKIGAGNYGSVFKCERDGMYSAIKIIPVPANDEELQMLLSRSAPDVVREYLKSKVDNYRREIRIMSEVLGSSCNIVTLQNYKIIPALDAPVSDDTPLGYHIVICMELLTSLTSHLTKHKLTRAEIITLGIDICSALMTCEKHNIVHRDIKPENILIHNDGAYKLGDFGVAKELSKTTAGTIAGTELYMAPEVSKGMEYNHTADIYSLGIVLYTLLNNGKVPYVKPDDKSLVAEQEAIVKRMNTDEILPFPPEADETLGNIVLKACMYKKEQRYQSAEIMQTDLIMALHGRKVEVDLTETAGLGVEYGKGTTSDKDQSPFSKSMMGHSVSRKDEPQKKTGEIPPEPPKKKKKTGLIIGVAVAVLAVGGIGLGVVTGMQDKPTTYVDSQGNTVQALSRNEMEDAYTLGMQYYEQGNYESAIAELNKVTNKSGKYEEAQAAMVAAMTAYKDGLIEKSESYCASGNFEMALSILESGTALLGDNNDLMVQQKNVLNQLKIDHINKASDAEQSGDYATAYSYVQTALAFLPDDIELEGLYSRLEAMTAMTTALQDAENYAAMEDYAKLFSSLEDAMNDVRGSTTASSKIKLAYDEYKKNFLNDIEAQIKNPTTVDEYSRAIDALNAAVDIFPDEYELKRKQESLQLMRVALDAMVKAEDYYKASDLKNVFAVLEKVMPEVKLHEEAYDKVCKQYEEYRSDYVQDLFTVIGNPQTVTEYDNAISTLETAVGILSDNDELSNKLNTLKMNRPVDLFSLNVVDAKWRYPNYNEWKTLNVDDTEYLAFNQYTTDNYGTKYDNSTVIWIGEGWYKSNNTYIMYDCANYDKLTGTVAINETSKSYTGTLKFWISAYTDDMTEHTLYNETFPSGTRPQKIHVDLRNYSLVKIAIYCDSSKSNSWASFILSDFTLSK